MARPVFAFLLALVACTPAQSPGARKVGAGLALGGVGGMIASAATVHVNTHTHEFVAGFSVITLVGVAMYAAGDLSEPASVQETIPERHNRWARILTERAMGAARDGRCKRVRRLETKVRGYDRVVHDVVFMRDSEILKCMTGEGPPPPPPPTVPALGPDADLDPGDPPEEPPP